MTHTVHNPMDDIGGPSQLSMMDYDFLPSIEIRKLQSKHNLRGFNIEQSLTEGDRLDVDPLKLQQYFSTDLVIVTKS